LEDLCDYQIEVDGYRGAAGNVRLSLTQTSTVAGLIAPAGWNGAITGAVSGWLQWLQDQGNQNLIAGGSTRGVPTATVQALAAFFAALGRRR